MEEDRDALSRVRPLGAFLAWMPPVAEELENDERSAQNDRGVGHVERVPVMFADVKIDEVGDAAAQHAVENIARRAAQNQREAPLAERDRRRDPWRAATRAAQSPPPRKESAPGPSRAPESASEAERNTGIAGVHEV